MGVLAFLFSGVLFIKFQTLFEITQARVASLLLFGLMPPTLLWTSVELREVWQLFF